MSWTAIAKRAVGYCLPKTVLDAIIDDLNDLNARSELLETGGVLNGSFQSDGDSDGIPDSWEADDAGGGSIGLDTSEYYHASQSAKITLGTTDQYGRLLSGESPSTAEYQPCHYGQRIHADFALKASAASIPASVSLRWFDAAGTQVGTDDEVWSTASAPTSWAVRHGQGVAPSGAYYYRLILQGGDAGGSAAGTLYWDAVQSRVYHGYVPVSATSVSTAFETITLAAGSGHFVAGERPLRAFVEVVLTSNADPGAAAAARVSGNGVTGFRVEAATGGLTVAGHGWVELNDSYQFAVALLSGTADAVATNLLGYEV